MTISSKLPPGDGGEVRARGLRWRRTTRLVLLGAVLFCAAAAGFVLLRRGLAADARRVAASLLACPVDEIAVEPLALGWTDRWRVEGCGARGTMQCEPSDPKCAWVPDPR